MNTRNNYEAIVIKASLLSGRKKELTVAKTAFDINPTGWIELVKRIITNDEINDTENFNENYNENDYNLF